MFISLRLKGFLASAIVLSFGLSVFPIEARGQSIDNAPLAAETGQNPDQAARQALLQARQALAIGDLDTAKKSVETAKTTNADFQQIGDSPELLDSMIQRQSQLYNLHKAEDPSYNAQAVSFLLLQAEALLAYQDFDTAETLIQSAEEFGKFGLEFNSTTGFPESMKEKLRSARIEASAQHAANLKSQVLSLLAQAQLAIDQENWEQASQLVNQAKAMQVDESQFAATDPRPWQLELKVQNGLNRRSGMQSANLAQASLNVPTATDARKAKSGKVVQAGYDPAQDTTKVIQVAAEGEVDTPAQPIHSGEIIRLPVSGLDYYNEGLQLLAKNDKPAAIEHFQKAWQNREGLDGTVRLAIKTQLEKLAPDSDVLKATLASQETDLKLDQLKEDQRQAFRELQAEIFKERAAVDALLKTKPREALVRMQGLRGKVVQSKLEPDNQRPLLAVVDGDIAEMQKYIDQNLPEIMNDEANSDATETVERERQRKLDVEMQLQELVNNYNQLIKEERYAEAGEIVKRASALAPDSELVVLLTEKHRVKENLELALAIRAMKQQGFVDGLRAAEEASIPWPNDTPIALPPDLEDYSAKARKREDVLNMSRFNSPAEAKIFNLLENETVSGEFTGSLSDTMDQLAERMGVNIIFDDLALEAEQVNREKSVNINIRSPIGFKSALDVILQQVGLAYVVENEVIKITSKDALNSKMDAKTYYIGDLVMPMSQNPDPMKLNFIQPGGNQVANNGSFSVPQDGNGNGNLLGLAQQLGQSDPNSPFYRRGPQTGMASPFSQRGGETFGGITENDFQPLMDLITNTIGDSEKWDSEGGGAYSMRPFAANLSLIISAPQEIHDQVQSLLKKLRELNDVQIVIEVRFLTLNENFFEKIGIDFDFSINDDSGLTLAQAQGDRVPGNRSTVIGRVEPDGVDLITPTQNLDLRFTQGNFSAAVPQFGGTFVPGTAGNFGFAILSDIEVFFLIQAAKQDNRSVITQAPTVTMFNGQNASIFDGSQRPFVTAVIPVVGDFAVAHQPIITFLPDGTNLNVQATVTENRRFVRLNLVPMFSQITEVETFTFDGSTTTRRTSESVLNDLLRRLDPTRPAGDQDFETVTSGVTIQLPVISTTTISTVVSVPDGGTVLLGGIKRMSEGRSEGGLPLLSNIPYINRLFRNTAIGHTTSNQMMMVTPRIIIQKEIEEDMVGLNSGSN